MSVKLMGSIVLPERIIQGTMSLTAGKIERIEEGFVAEGEEVFDFRGKYLLPGLIEIHGHLREPGLDYKEDIPHGSRAGVAGGYTTLLDMPNTKPPTTTVARVQEQIARYTGRSYTDFAINMGTSLEDINELRRVEKELISAVKIFAAGHATTPTVIHRLSDLARVFEILGQRGLLAIVHAENQELVNYFTQRYREELGRHDPAAWSEARNLAVVLSSVLEVITLAKQFGVRLHLLHLSTPEEFAALEFGRSIGVDVTGEVTTVHLALSSDDYAEYGNLINIAPALRSRREQEALWRLLRAGKIDAVITDHAPHTLEEKLRKSVWEVSSGMPGLQEALSVLISGWIRQFGVETLEEGLICIAQVTSQNIARIFGLEQKGFFAPGKDADIVVVDAQQQWLVKEEDLFTKNRWSVFNGKQLTGRPIATFVRGNLVYREGQIVGMPQGQRVISHLS